MVFHMPFMARFKPSCHNDLVARYKCLYLANRWSELAWCIQIEIIWDYNSRDWTENITFCTRLKQTV